MVMVMMLEWNALQVSALANDMAVCVYLGDTSSLF